MRKSQWHKPYRVRRKKSPLRFLKNRFFWFSILILGFIGGVFYFVFFYQKIQIREIKVYGNQLVSPQDIQKLTEEKIIHKILFFNSKSIILVNESGIEKEISKNFPQIAKINLKRNFPTTLILEVEERKSIGVWCASQTQKCFNLDEMGIIFSENPESSDVLKIIDPERKDNINLGEKVINEGLLNSIAKIEAGLKENSIRGKEFVLSGENRLNIKTDENWQIYFNLKGDLNWQLEELNQVLQKEIPSAKRRNLEYIDLRFSKVYYKYR